MDHVAVSHTYQMLMREEAELEVELDLQRKIVAAQRWMGYRLFQAMTPPWTKGGERPSEEKVKRFLDLQEGLASVRDLTNAAEARIAVYQAQRTVLILARQDLVLAFTLAQFRALAYK